MNKIFGAKLKKAREELDLSQGAFAKAVGRSSEFISLLEAGKRTPSFDTLNRLAAYLHKEISYFFKEKEPGFKALFASEELGERERKILKSFQSYGEEYLRLEEATGRRLEVAPQSCGLSAERLASEERRRLDLGEEPIRDVFGLLEMNGLRLLRQPMPEDSKVSGIFVFLEDRAAAFALINSAQPVGRQAVIAVHEYCHLLKDRLDGPIIDGPDVFIDEYVSLYHPREQFAQLFAARFLMPPSRIQELTSREFGMRRLDFDDVLYLKRYFGVPTVDMLRTLRTLGLLDRPQFEEFFKRDAAPREKEIFGKASEDGDETWLGRFKKRAVPSDRFKLLSRQ